MSSRGKGDRTTPAEQARIVELKLAGHTRRQVMDIVGCAQNTVDLHWHAFLDEQAEHNRQHLERRQAMVSARLIDAAERARRGFDSLTMTAPVRPDGNVDEDGPPTFLSLDPAGATAYLRAELRALNQLADIYGMKRLTITGSVEGVRLPTRDEAQAALDKLAKNKTSAKGKTKGRRST